MKFEVMWNNEHRVMSQSWENFLLCCNRLVIDILLPTIMASTIKLFGDFLNFELTTVARVYYFIGLKLAETFPNWVINIV